jgi:hypothetical protein
LPGRQVPAKQMIFLFFLPPMLRPGFHAQKKRLRRALAQCRAAAGIHGCAC